MLSIVVGIAGVILVIVGIALIYVPAAIIAIGVLASAWALLFTTEVK